MYANLPRWYFALLLLAASVGRAADESGAHETQTSAPCAARDDELWLISTRQCDCDAAPACDLDVRRQNSGGGWDDSSLGEFLALEPRWTVVYVHGNRVDWYEAHRRGQTAYHAILGCGQEIPRMRFVIWSWPSDQIRGPLRDVREKSDRADWESSYFGWFLSQIPPANRLSLFGYSYGARVIGGGLHLMGGGVWNGHQLAAPWPATEHRHVRAVYMAAAFDRCWICEGSCHGQSLATIDRLLITYNPCDPALARFHVTDPCTRPAALGFEGVSSSCFGAAAARVEQLDVSGMIGGTHDEQAYWCNGELIGELCRVIVWPETP
jgi:hypothetical protein